MRRSTLMPGPARRGIALAAAVGVAALGLTACSSDSSSGSSDTISIGVPIANTASLAQAGVSAPGSVTGKDVQLMYETALKTVSGTDAAGGYKIEGKYTTFNLVQTGAPQTACLHLVRDERVDVVMAGQFVNGGDQCVVQRGGTLIQSIAAPQAAYGMKQGVVYTNDLLPTDAATNFASYLTSRAQLQGKTIGVLTDALGGDAAPVNDVLVPALKKAGLKIAHVTTLSADLTQVAQQVPVEVAQMRDAGVTTIIDVTPSANLMQFLGGMAKSGWNVPFIASDLNNAVDETFAAAYPKTFQAIGYTARRFSADNATATACYKNYQAAGGKALPVGSTGYQTNLEICDQVAVLAAGLKKLDGRSFTKKTFDQALHKGGDLDVAYFGPSTLSADSNSTARSLHTVTWKTGHWAGTDDKWTAITHG